jgi:type VI secretion system protein ImpF
MATPAGVRDRLQPALLDRLIDPAPDSAVEAEDRRVMSRQALRQAVLRDLGWLLNAVQPMPLAQADAHPLAARSVLNFGLPPLSGQLASRVDVGMLERSLRDAIARFEPRILAETLRVRALESRDVLDSHNVIAFEISGQLWAQPVPLELLLRTELDLEEGKVELRDLTARGLGAPAAGGRG